MNPTVREVNYSRIIKAVKSSPDERKVNLCDACFLFHPFQLMTAEFPEVKRLNLMNSIFCGQDDLLRIASMFPNLRELNLSQCCYGGIRQINLRDISSLEQLESLNLSQCNLHHCEALSLLKKLRCLTLSATDVKVQDLEAISSLLSRLQHLDLSRCVELGVGTVLPFSPFLSVLNLSGTDITKEGLQKMLSRTPRIQMLYLFETKVDADVLAAVLPGLSVLNTLDFSFCDNITAEGLEAVLKVVFSSSCRTNLRHLNLSGCRITDNTLGVIKDASALSSLESLGLSFCNNITDQGLQEMLSAMTNLHNCDTYGCKGLATDGCNEANSLSPS